MPTKAELLADFAALKGSDPASSDNLNCVGCTDCTRCIDCTDCELCIACVNCYQCDGCENVYNAVLCVGMQNLPDGRYYVLNRLVNKAAFDEAVAALTSEDG